MAASDADIPLYVVILLTWVSELHGCEARATKSGPTMPITSLIRHHTAYGAVASKEALKS